MGGAPRILRVDEHGVVLLSLTDVPVDVALDGRRVWTFWTLRDTSRRTVPVLRWIEWPAPLRPYLDGTGRVTLRDPRTTRAIYERDLLLGDGEGRIDVRNEYGIELGIDKSGRLVPTFSGISGDDLEALLSATESVVEALRGVGVEPFLAYGTLLGAVREGAVLPHDSDVDLGYVSRATAPVDVALESFRIQRALVEQGWNTYRYSGAAFRVMVEQADSTIGLDVFGGFHDHGRLYLLGEVGTEFEQEWIWPLGTCELSGRPMPVPARPEKFLEAMYGPRWRVPDPAFQFTTPPRTVRALGDWFRGTQPGQRFWERRANTTLDMALRGPYGVAREAAEHAEALGAEVLEIGSFRGSDSLWLARQGLSVTAYDYVPKAMTRALRHVAEEGLDLRVRHLNLTEWRSVLSEGARLAHDPRPRVIVARHVLDATSSVGRESFARLCSMALRRGGVVIAVFHVPDPDGPELEPREWMVGEVDADAMATLLRRGGATRVETSQVADREWPTVKLVAEFGDAGEDHATEIDTNHAAGVGAAGRGPGG